MIITSIMLVSFVCNTFNDCRPTFLVSYYSNREQCELDRQSQIIRDWPSLKRNKNLTPIVTSCCASTMPIDCKPI